MDTVEREPPPSAAGGTAASSAVGQLLRETREAKHLDLRGVADILRIRRAHLESLEDGRHDRLPGATYAVGFVRTYADYLGLDGNEIARRFKQETAIEPENAELDFPTPVSEGGLPSAALLLVAVVLGAGVYGLWYWNTTADRPLTEIIEDVPDRLQAMLSQEPAVPERDETAAEADGAEPVALTADAPAPAPTEPETAPAAESVEPADAPEPAESPLASLPSMPAEEEPQDVIPPGEEPTPVPANDPAPPPSVGAAEPAEPAVAAVPAMEEQVDAPVPAEPEQEMAVTPPAEPAAQAVETGAAAPEAGEPETAEVEAPAAAVTPEPEPAPEAEVAAEVAAVDPETAAPPPVAGPGKVVVRATSDAWVQVRAGSRLLLSRLLRKGDSYEVPQGDDLVLMTGNAGGTRIEIDGRQLPPLGGAGEVRRGIPLDAAKLRRTFANPS